MGLKLFNDDCLKIMQQLQADSIDCIITDPPYGVGFKNELYDDSLEYVQEKIPLWFKEWYRLLKENSYLYLFVGVKTLHLWIQQGIKQGFVFKNIIATSTFHSDKIRCKNNFNFQFQPIIVFSKGKGKEFNTVNFIPTSDSWVKDKRNKNPKQFTYDYPNFIKPEWAFSNIKRKQWERIHPNEKNPKLIKFFIELSTKENDVVLDCFMGSGSTGVASKLSYRNFIGVEIDKEMFEKAQNNINSYYVSKKLF